MYILTLKHTKNYKQQNNSCECKKKRFTIFYKTSVHTYTFASTNFDDFNCLCTSVNIHFSSLTMDMLRLCNVNLSLKKRRIFYWQSIVYYYFRKCYYWFFLVWRKPEWIGENIPSITICFLIWLSDSSTDTWKGFSRDKELKKLSR